MKVFPFVLVDPEPEYLIFSNRHEMRSVDLSNHNYAALVSGLHNTVALDFYYNKSFIFWTDVADDKIFRGKLQGNGMFLFPVKLCCCIQFCLWFKWDLFEKYKKETLHLVADYS